MAAAPNKQGDTGDRGEIAELPPLLRLSTELLDRIVQLSVPLSSPRLARKRLAVLLQVHPLLVPIVRRALYRKLNLVVGDPNHRSDLKLLDLLEGQQGTGAAGPFVQYLRVRVPDPPDNVVLHPGQDPAFALLPRPHLDPAETLALVARAVNLVPNLRHIEINLQVGCALEDEINDDPGTVDRGALESFARGMKRWSNRLETCVSAVEDPKQRLQIWADTLRISPHVRALAEWNNLTRLDLWRVRLVLPRNAPAGATSSRAIAPSLPVPNFRLRELVLTQCELGGQFELEWLLGSSAHSENTPSSRSTRLKKLVLDQVEFDETPKSSAPIQAALFPTTAASTTGKAPAPPPPFANTLEHFVLVLPYPFISQDGASSSRGLLAGLTALKTVELGGPGVDEPLLSSLFTACNDHESVSSTSERNRTPSTTVRDLSLNYLTSIPVSTILAHFENNATSASALNDLASHPLRDLETLTFKTSWDLPRRWSWEQRQRTREPIWYQVHLYAEQLGEDPRATSTVATSNATAQDLEAMRRNRQGWDEVQRTVKAFVKERNRLSVRAGVNPSSRAPLRLFKNRLECTYDEEATDDEEEEEEDHGGEAGSDDGDDDRGARSASEMDMNALFVPSSGDEEDQNAWVRRRLEEEEEYESDF